MARDWTLKQVSLAFGCLYVATLVVGAVILWAVLTHQRTETNLQERQACLATNQARQQANARARRQALFITSDAFLRASEGGARTRVERRVTGLWERLAPGVAQRTPYLPECATKRLLAADQRDANQVQAMGDAFSP